MAERRVITSEQIRQMYTRLKLVTALRREGEAAHSTGEQPTLTEDKKFFVGLASAIERKQHLGSALRNRVVVGQEGIECLSEPVKPEDQTRDPFDPRSEHYWRNLI